MSRLALAFDTATERCALALGRWTPEGLDVLVEADFDAPRAALGRLLPAIRDLLVAEGLTPGDLAEVVVGRGPGSFTGVRIGVATAKGLAHGLGTPLYGVGTLDAIAWACATAGHEGVLGVVGDAMRGEVYPALFELRAGRAHRMTSDRVERPSDVVAEWSTLGCPLLLAGGGIARYRTSFDTLCEMTFATFVSQELWRPGGAGLLAAHAFAVERGETGDVSPEHLLPIYTRLSDAEENERVRENAESRLSGDEQALPPSGVSEPPEGGGSS